jgi:hypothetical protein
LRELGDFETNLYGKYAQIYIKQQIGETQKVSLQRNIEELSHRISQYTAEQQNVLERMLYDRAEEIQQEIDRMQ